MVAVESEFLLDGPQSPRLVLAHGAGAPMDSEFMARMAELLAERGVGVVRFEFPYMRERRESGKKRPPNRQPELLDCWRSVVESLGDCDRLFIGGKSMGGRMASLLIDELADELGVKGLVCLGYPFHPPGKPEKLRTEHLLDLKTRALIVQGTRDSMGKRDEVGGYGLSSAIDVQWLEDGDHDLKPRVRSGFTHDQHLESAADIVSRFVLST
ncbi:alpha/beta fold hydrolase [Pseudomaricurvus alkylphenolicus]|jgi:predicted alpha/beta-hydrolase family hydrolase|nr:alpha/beta fold hydrolase [Pseudomaricurvus alkylphenolicus]